jgi:hypothetical protein
MDVKFHRHQTERVFEAVVSKQSEPHNCSQNSYQPSNKLAAKRRACDTSNAFDHAREHPKI